MKAALRHRLPSPARTRVDLGKDRAVGPGRSGCWRRSATPVDHQAGVALGMSYRRAWLLVNDMNNCFHEPVVAAQRAVAMAAARR